MIPAEHALGDHWAEAACLDADPEVFFSDGQGSTNVHHAKRICNGDGDRPACPVRDLCLEYALERQEPYGTWGGYSARERRALLRQRRRSA